MATNSNLERRLWLAATAVLATIYLTLAYVRPVSDALRDRGLLRPTMIVAFLALAAGVVILWRRAAPHLRPKAREIAVLVLSAVLYVAILATMKRAEEAFHFVEYGLVAGLIYGALLARQQRLQGLGGTRLRPALNPALLTIALTAVAGAVDEGIQKLLPSRYFDVRDIVFNSVAGLLGVIVVSAWLAVRSAADRNQPAG